MTEEKNDAAAKPAIVHMTVEVKRANTGKIETYELVGTATPDKPESEPQQQEA